MPSKRHILEAMKRPQLQKLATAFGVKVDDRRSRDALVDGLAVARRAAIADLLAKLPVAALHQLCGELDLSPGPRQKAKLVDHIVGKSGVARKAEASGRTKTAKTSRRGGAVGSRSRAKTTRETAAKRKKAITTTKTAQKATRPPVKARMGTTPTAAVPDDDHARVDIEAPVAAEPAATIESTEPANTASPVEVEGVRTIDADAATPLPASEPSTAAEGSGDVAEVISSHEDDVVASSAPQDAPESDAEPEYEAEVVRLDVQQSAAVTRTEAPVGDDKDLPLPPVVPNTVEDIERAVVLLGNRVRNELRRGPRHELEALIGKYPTRTDAVAWKISLKRMRKELMEAIRWTPPDYSL
jgi:hypothetical protein